MYLDHAATTPIHPKVVEAITPWYESGMAGNPGSIHTSGVVARQAVEKARAQVASMINAKPSEIYFTSGGTEANNTWLRCIKKQIVITDKIEHHSVLEPIQHGVVSSVYVQPVYVAVDKSGRVDLDSLAAVLEANRGLVGGVSIMWVNNELGTINPMKEICDLCKKHDVILHTDAVQAVGHIPVDVRCCDVDMLSLSGHKFGGPMGTGALYIKDGVLRSPLIRGGGQEQGMRSGTENVPGIVGLGVAAELAKENLPTLQEKWRALRREFIGVLKDNMTTPFHINESAQTAPNIISLTIPGFESESTLLRLDAEGICVSAGSACSAASGEVSHVLTGIGIAHDMAACTLRISMGADTTQHEVECAAKTITYVTNPAKIFSYNLGILP